MAELTICPVCQHRNLVGSLICARCGAPLSNAAIISRTTRHVPQLSPDMPNSQSLATDLAVGALVIVIDGKAPIIFENVQRILLGRAPISKDIPILDLSLYDGFQLGVSRHHASIVRKDDGFFVRDEGSSNGSWVNQKQLQALVPHPIQNGDTVRLAQLSFRVYFRSSKPETKLLMLHRAVPDQPFTPQELTDSLSPFLLAVSHLQDVANTLLKRKGADVTIESIQIKISIIQIQLAGAAEALNFIISTPPTLKRPEENPPPSPLSDPGQTKEQHSSFADLAPFDKDQLTQSARTFLSGLSIPPEAQDVNFETYVQALLPDFYILATSSIKITNSRDND